jgi:hypothetical protein
MALKQRIIIIWASFMTSKNAVAASGGATLAAMAVFDDWITWAVSGAGAIAYNLKRAEGRKMESIAYGIVSIGAGGFGGPYAVSLVTAEGRPEPSVYLCSFVLAIAAPYLWDRYAKGGKK